MAEYNLPSSKSKVAPACGLLGRPRIRRRTDAKALSEGAAAVGLTPEDRQQIQDLLIRYTYAVDLDGTEEDLVAIFTEDAVLDSPISGHHAGVEGVRLFMRKAQARRLEMQTRHYATNFRIEGDGDRATLRAYMMLLMTNRKPQPPHRHRTTEFQFAGHYECTARKVDGKWRLDRRTVYVDSES
jgi:hypothetical protein